jgi:outer membrane murein-binding lipoprotein Lpp
MKRWQGSLFLAVGAVAIGGVMLAGCAEQKAAPAPSQRQVQSDSDRFFDKMKQEERDHGTGPQTEK